MRALVDSANAHRAKRDELNAKVREGKIARDALNRAAQEKAEAFHALRQAQSPEQANVIPLPKLKAELRRLEYEQQTKVLTPQKEKALIELIAQRQKEIREREGASGETDDTRGAFEAMREAKAKAEEQHRAVTAIAQEAQGEHEQMVQLFAQADAMRKLADAEQAEFVRNKVQSDKVHREYMDMVQQIRDLERVTHALRGGERREERAHGPTATAGERAAADEIFDRFRKGEKLSTEDLMALQKAGRL